MEIKLALLRRLRFARPLYAWVALVLLLTFVVLGLALAAVSLRVKAASTGPALSVNAGAGQLPINPAIYGITFFWSSDANQRATELAYANLVKLPLNRNGGDATTRYNWQVDSSNAGFDWFYMGGGGTTNPTPGASIDSFVDTNRSIGAKSVLTIPTIEYINKSSDWHCSFPQSVYGAQQSYNPYVHPNNDNCGNGVSSGGSNLNDTQVSNHDIPNTPAIQQGWVQHLKSRYGSAGSNGIIYQLDNEPHNWGFMHRDVHPNAVTEDEIINQNIAYAAAIKASDPSAWVAGPSEIQFGWYPDWGGDTNTVAYLQKMKQYEAQNGKRLIDSFDVHYPDSDDNHYPKLTDIDHLKGIVDQTYPGTKISVSEWTGGNDLNGGLFTADQLGVYARAGVVWASYWGIDLNSPAAYAYKLYRNYDGAGKGFGETYVQSASASDAQLSVYAAQRTGDGSLTIVVINKSGSDLTSNLSLSGFTPAAAAQVYRYSGSNTSAIVRQGDQSLSATGFNATYPANSMTMIVIPKQTVAPTTAAPTTVAPTTAVPTTVVPTTPAPTTVVPTTIVQTTIAPTTAAPTTLIPTTVAPTTVVATTSVPTTVIQTTIAPTTAAPTTAIPTTVVQTTAIPTTTLPTTAATTTTAIATIPPATTTPDTTVPVTTIPATVAPTNTPPPTTPAGGNGGGSPTLSRSTVQGQVLVDDQPAAGFVVQLDPLKAAQTTQADGNYSFTGLAADTYVVRLGNFDQQKFSLVGPDHYDLTLNGSDSPGKLNFLLKTRLTPQPTPTPSPTPVGGTGGSLTCTLPKWAVSLNGATSSNQQNLSVTDPSYKTWARYDFFAPNRRSYVWGSKPFALANEPYLQAVNQVGLNTRQRKVLYWDKSRMEMTNPGANPASLGYITNGLLVVELITGRVQLGDQLNEAAQRMQCAASQQPVAGDGDDTHGPTYASLANRLSDPALGVGSPVTAAIDHTGQLSKVEPGLLDRYKVTGGYYEPITRHMIASPFWNFLNSNQSGVWQNGQNVTSKLFDPYWYAPGLPITEAYWAKVKVGGQVKDVLIQAFERRVLTYTPSNPTAYQVEWGNVGLHYYQWRYSLFGL